MGQPAGGGLGQSTHPRRPKRTVRKKKKYSGGKPAGREERKRSAGRAAAEEGQRVGFRKTATEKGKRWGSGRTAFREGKKRRAAEKQRNRIQETVGKRTI